MVSEEKIREAFSKLKKDMQDMREELATVKNNLRDMSAKIEEKTTKLSAEAPNYAPNFTESFKKESFGTSRHSNLEENQKMPNKVDIGAIGPVSIGNEGVSALRQQIGNELGTSKTLQDNVERLKKALKDTFKRLTRQEFQIFSLLYQLEDELKRPVTYKDLASRSNLTPNSLRDYISKLIIKKVPIIKEKLNNRQVLLKIAPELRNIETLENLMRIVES